MLVTYYWFLDLNYYNFPGTVYAQLAINRRSAIGFTAGTPTAKNGNAGEVEWSETLKPPV